MRTLSLLLWLTFFSIQATAVTVIRPQSEFDASHDYFVGLLQMALDLTQEEFGPEQVTFTRSVLQQGRALAELKHNTGQLDVYWAGTDSLREKELRPIRIPLIKGALGIRVAIIRKDRLNDFQQIHTLADLQHFSACQGTHWPDSDILENAGIRVLRNPVYEPMFAMVNAGRCDYFPRGIHEGFVEMKAREQQYPELMLYEGLLIQYRFPMYFFVAQSNKALAIRIEKGLRAAQANGQFDRYMQQHPTTAHLYPLASWIHRPSVHLPNPDLPDETPLQDKNLWMTRLPE